jgi:hypothetical protein
MSKPDTMNFMPEPEKGDKGPKSGRVSRDARGNAVWEWSTSTGSFAREVNSQRLKRLEHPGLAIAEDEKPGTATATATATISPAQINKKASRLGYDPYQSEVIAKNVKPKKKDLRELSKWIQMKKKIDDKAD